MSDPTTTIRRNKLLSFLELMRPANIITAFADILAGFAAAGGIILFHDSSISIQPEGNALLWLLLSTFGLYGGGVVFNDVFDTELDTKERPERPIPSGRISKTEASVQACLLLLIGIIAAFQVTITSGVLAAGIAFCVLIYDKWAKHHTFLGPLAMGICRGGNLLLGATILPATLASIGFLGFIPLAYIAAITLVSQGEVHGGSRTAGYAAVGAIGLVIATLAALAFLSDYQLLTALPFILLFSFLIVPPFWQAARQPEAKLIRKAIKRGILSLIILNSTLAAGFAGIAFGSLILLLLPISLLLSKLFSVT